MYVCILTWLNSNMIQLTFKAIKYSILLVGVQANRLRTVIKLVIRVPEKIAKVTCLMVVLPGHSIKIITNFYR